MQSPLESQGNINITDSHNTDIVLPYSEPKGYDELLDDYQAALTGKARLIQAYNSLGITFFQQGQFEQAIANFQKILDFSADLPPAEHAKVYFNIAMAQRRLGQVEEAIANVQKATELDPDFYEARLDLARHDYETQVAFKGYEFTQDWFSRGILTLQNIFNPLLGQPNLHMLEIGCWEGRATCWLLEQVLVHPSATLTCVDTFAGSAEHHAHFSAEYLQSIEARFDRNIAKTGAANKVEKRVGLSQEVMRSLHLNHYDAIYVDGSHVACDVLTDGVLGWGLLKVGGLMLFDDYDFGVRFPNQNTKVGIDAFLSCFAHKLELLHQSHLVVVRKTN